MKPKKKWLQTRQADDSVHNLFYGHLSSRPSLMSGSVPKKKEPEKKKEEKKEAAQEAKACKHQGLTIQCGHQERNYQLVLPSQDPKASKVLQVVGGPEKGDKISVSTKLLAGPCDQHKGKILAVQGAKPEKLTDTELSFLALCDPQYSLSCKKLWLSPVTPTGYTVSVDSCESPDKASARIEAFPDLEWEVEIKLGGGSTTSESGKSPKSTLDVSGSIKKTVEKVSKDISYEMKNALPEMIQPWKYSQKIADAVFEKLGKLINKSGIKTELTIDWPKIAIKGKWGYKELPKSGKVCYEVDVSLAANPILGVKGKMDILDAVCMLYPPILRIKKIVEGDGKRVGVVIALWLKAGGEITGGVEVKFKQEKSQIAGGIGGKITFGLEGELKGTLDVWFVTVKAGATLEGSSGFSGKLQGGIDKKGPFIEGKLAWDGLEIKATYYCSADLKFVSEDKVQGSKSKTIIEPKEWTWANVYLFTERS